METSPSRDEVMGRGGGESGKREKSIILSRSTGGQEESEGGAHRGQKPHQCMWRRAANGMHGWRQDFPHAQPPGLSSVGESPGQAGRCHTQSKTMSPCIFLHQARMECACRVAMLRHYIHRHPHSLALPCQAHDACDSTRRLTLPSHTSLGGSGCVNRLGQCQEADIRATR